MNFLRRAGAILMVVAIFASSCNKYADDFDQVNTKLDALASQVAGITQITTDVSALKSQITSLQTAVAALPSATQQTAQFAAVTTSLTAMTTAIAAIDTQVKAVAATGTATKAQVDKLVTDLKALSDKVTAENATLVKNTNDAITKLNALDVKVSGLDTKLADMATTMTALAAAVVKVQEGVDANKLGIAALAMKLDEQATAVAKIGTDLAANTAADLTAADAAAAAAIADATAAAAIIADQATTLAKIAELQTAIANNAQTGADTDTATALTIKGLQLMLTAQKAQLDVIIANTALKVTGATISGNVNVGGILSVASTPADATVDIQWMVASTSGGTYANIAGATATKYTIATGDLDKYIKVKLTGTGSYANSSITSAATAKVAVMVPVTAVAIAGTAQVGATLTATTTPTVASGATVSFQWQSAATLTGSYTDIAGATKATYKTVTDDATRFVRVIVTGIEGYTGVVTSNVIGAIAFTDVTTASFTMTTTMNTIVVTLTDGTFTAGVAKANFTMVGLDAALATWTGSTFTRVSNTQVKFQTSTVGGYGATSANTITIANAAMATQATAATAAGSVDVIIVPVGAAIAGVTAPVAGATAVTTATLTGGTVSSVSWSPALNAGKFNPGLVYTATITLTANAGYTLTGVTANYYTVAGATVTNPVNSGVATAVFPATAVINVTIAAIAGVTAPVTGATAVTTITGNAEYTGVVSWAPALVAGKFQSGVTYTATINLVPNLGYSVTALAANFFTVAGSAPAATTPAGTGNVTAAFPATL